MSGELPDWGYFGPSSPVYAVQDLGELAARLGSLVTYDRGGEFIWGDDFECGTGKWLSELSGTGAAAASSSTYARNGRTSVALTGGSNASRMSRFRHYRGVPVLSRLGFEFSWMQLTANDYLELELQIYTGAQLVDYMIRLDPPNLQYLDSAGVMQNISVAVSPHFDATVPLWHTWKLVIDASDREYHRLKLDDVTYDLADIDARVTVDATAAHWRLYMTNVSRAGNNDIVYVDDAIVTQSEPQL